MSTPWIETKKYPDQSNLARSGSEYTWQAMFACQVKILPHQEWVKMRWGFNASALFDEALERQKLFLTSQHEAKGGLSIENLDHRTLAFRYITRPSDGLLVTVLAKILGRTQVEADHKALAYYREIKSTFPYDYSLVPAASKDDFIYFTGEDILEDVNTLHLAQIRRLEVPIHPSNKSPILQGLWQSGPRAHEQIWRFLAASPHPVLLNSSIRCSVLYERDRELMLGSADRIENFTDGSMNQVTLSALKSWNEKYIERRLAPWKKFFYLQVHLASTQEIDENAYRILGTSLSLSPSGHSSPDYQVILARKHEVTSWQEKLKNLDFVNSGSYLSAPRLTEIADMEEVFAVMRLPYLPPENGFPDMKFADTRDSKKNNEV